MRLSDILKLSHIKVPLVAKNKKEAIGEMVQLLADAGEVKDAKILLNSVLEREATRTTGIGNALAIPHGKCAAVTELIMAVGKPAAPLDFESIDGKPVNIVIFLASPPDRTGPHIQALARISRLMTDQRFRHALDAASTAQAVYDVFASFEGSEFH